MKHRILSNLKKIRKNLTKKLANTSKENRLVVFFVFLFLIVVGRLFTLQVVNGAEYTQKLIDQHYTKSSLDAERGHVYVTDKSGESLKMTENINLYTLFVDPKFVGDKETLIADLAPILYDHFCTLYELTEPSKIECLQHLQEYIKEDILPKQPQIFYTTGSILGSDDLDILPNDLLANIPYDNQIQEIFDYYTPEVIISAIKHRLEETIQTGLRERNYIGYYDKQDDLDLIQESGLASIENIDGYVYINPSRVVNASKESKILAGLLNTLETPIDEDVLESRYLVSQENRYVKIVSGLNVKYIDRVQKIKDIYRDNRLNKDKKNGKGYDLQYPLFHGVGMDVYQKRYYPHGTFLSHVVGYLDNAGQAYYGVEEFFDKQLSGIQGRIVGLATPRVGQVGSNNVVIEQPVDGVDVYLTLDPIVQKELESTVRKYLGFLRADSIAVTIIDPDTGEIRAMANAPDFDPNNYAQAYDMQPLGPEERYLIEDDSRADIPLFTFTGGNLIQANTEQRQDLTTEKYFFKNFLGPQVFVDKNISFPYEPGSVFKALTLGIGIDSDALSMYDFYFDPGFVKIGIYEIANIANACKGSHTFEHALAYSCNVGMVRIAQRVYKYVFYDYLDKLGFGKMTGIELGQEDGGFLDDYNTVSFARYFNNTFGQGLLATPLQMAVSYSALLNGGRHIEPTIVESIYDPNQERFLDLAESNKTKIFKTKTSLDIKDALVNVIDHGGLNEIQKPGYSLAGKTGTSEITFKGGYRGGRGRTNGSFVGAVTASETKYVIAIQVRRPRSSERGLDTAGAMYESLAEFLIGYEQIEE